MTIPRNFQEKFPDHAHEDQHVRMSKVLQIRTRGMLPCQSWATMTRNRSLRLFEHQIWPLMALFDAE
ncbi:hypothetical protein L596_005421 [Steinernema carpocapsae]|uniref:Uncharacterized protein n=1 Tax=Steinernema carpocapsae TaxID=34508 RepID=A0A4U8UZ76_STECR|nr:hypothetical protein L596_005421 [Steinernema carpocapsae]